MNPVARDAARLRAALDYPEPASVPDVASIIASGRAARARRQVLGSVAAVAVVAAAVVAVVVPLRPPAPPIAAPDLTAMASLPGGPAPAALVAHGSASAEVPTAFDPLTRTLDVGWVPDGLDGGGATVETHVQYYGAHDDAYVNGGPDIGLSVTVLSRGRGVDELPTGAFGLPHDAEPRPTDTIRGARTECLSDPAVPTGTCTALRWEYAPGAWAQVSYAGNAGPTPETAAAVARRVAESVSLAAPEPVLLPFTLSGRLAGLEPTRTSVRLSDDVDPIDRTRWYTAIEFAPADGVDRDQRLHVSNVPGATALLRSNAVVDDVPALLDPTGLSLRYTDGTKVELIDVPDVLAAFGDIALVDDPVDPAGWVAPLDR